MRDGFRETLSGIWTTKTDTAWTWVFKELALIGQDEHGLSA